MHEHGSYQINSLAAGTSVLTALTFQHSSEPDIVVPVISGITSGTVQVIAQYRIDKKSINVTNLNQGSGASGIKICWVAIWL